ncbi:unnamed protein product [Tilletia controversa]|uniref:Uncharacterized protein n=3 Tax=Tilletia TaxID=13289 RepID=A0A8X7SV70_9BASI|nr:hypothetical protein CF336_g7378 [Tilletia laevis]KAE8186279.1 hypothetical protein CF328_g7280 [Tilletia controversa]KAE8247314.1 hypothetical protein A4X03_0g7081 [Tilletia caries]KAE8187636.1 hypothetical protein CF335_g7117 [Tilletia laevis]KAE8243997.1 hypothetical protein A4X06_0g6020 [Tilletia controversa]
MSKLCLEMYAGAIDDACTAEEKFCASLPPGRMPNAARTVVAELKAIQGFSQSMIGQDIKKAHENLEGAIKLIEGSAISFAPEDPFETRECAAALSWLAGFSCAAGEKKTALFQAKEAVNIMRARIWGREEEENSDCEELDIDKSTSDYEVLEYARTLLVLSAVLAANGKKKKAKARIEACWKWVQGRKVEDSTLKTILLLRAHILDLTGTTSQAQTLRNQASRIGKAGYFDRLVRCNGA